MGLRRAFLLAGARRVLATLWKVPDQETQMLMGEFVRRWRGGQPAVSALREAQLWLMRQKKGHVDAAASLQRGQAVTVRGTPYRHPFYWAAFTLTGDWR